jgi:hypothetical protein
MKRAAAILLLLYSTSVTPEQSNPQWWWPSVFGYCTRTDKIELGGGGKLEVKRKQEWNK